MEAALPDNRVLFLRQVEEEEVGGGSVRARCGGKLQFAFVADARLVAGAEGFAVEFQVAGNRKNIGAAAVAEFVRGRLAGCKKRSVDRRVLVNLNRVRPVRRASREHPAWLSRRFPKDR